jgi:hypothetical protein
MEGSPGRRPPGELMGASDGVGAGEMPEGVGGPWGPSGTEESCRDRGGAELEGLSVSS